MTTKTFEVPQTLTKRKEENYGITKERWCSKYN